ncbi:MAG: GerAB/ArcD/ProY family transporter [Oscillospiraceae bacterium]|nr:GerAB/ArcD/ProY family transporter [Oscillospiraceae bacterium]
MRIDSSKISKRQLLTMLYVSRASVLLYPAVFLGQALPAAAVAYAALLLVAITLLLDAALRNKRLGTAGKSASFKWISAAIFALALCESFSLLSDELHNVYAGGAPLLALTAFAIFAVWFGLKNGIEGCARFSFLCAVILCVSLLFLVLFNVDKFEYTKLLPASGIDAQSVLLAFVRLALLCPEAILLPVFAPYVNEAICCGDVHRFLRVQAIAVALFCVFSGGILGNLAFLDAPPIHLLATLGEFSFFRRLDALRVGAFVIVLLVRLIAFSEGINILLRSRIKSTRHISMSTVSILVCVCAAAAALLFAQWKEKGLFASTLLITLAYGYQILRREKRHE